MCARTRVCEHEHMCVLVCVLVQLSCPRLAVLLAVGIKGRRRREVRDEGYLRIQGQVNNLRWNSQSALLYSDVTHLTRPLA